LYISFYLKLATFLVLQTHVASDDVQVLIIIVDVCLRLHCEHFGLVGAASIIITAHKSLIILLVHGKHTAGIHHTLNVCSLILFQYFVLFLLHQSTLMQNAFLGYFAK
jgi:hypothetical protein